MIIGIDFYLCIIFYEFKIKNKVPDSLSKDAWENQTIVRLQKELKQVRPLAPNWMLSLSEYVSF